MNESKEVLEIWFELIKTQLILEGFMKGSHYTRNSLEKNESEAFNILKSRFPSLGIIRK